LIATEGHDVKIANLKGRLALVIGDGQAIDVETASGGRFSSTIQDVYSVWSDFTQWAKTAPKTDSVTFELSDLGSPTPDPSQVFAIGLNYATHAAESGFKVPEQPVVFTKYQSCLTGPTGEIVIPTGGNVDWETELVVVIGKEASNVSVEDAWNFVAGLTLGQDISERITQAAGPAPQFGLGKSFANFGPTGPVVVTTDEFANRDAIRLGCSINGEEMQNGNTEDFIFPVSELISRLSKIVTLRAGDIIFTGTPAGVGLGRTPQVYLKPGDLLETWAEGIGELRHVFTAAS
jgi:2-keto-4-pentenoate hydratase/2-oxohepta-3-ene-1,7-dioic acid hydratase in catechol pathway